MLFEIDTHSGVPIFRQVIDQIRRQITTGLLPEGRQLETVRDLAARLKVNPMTISKAYSLLEAEGLLERRRGVGLFVTPINQDKAARLKTELLDAALSKAAMTAIQLGLSETEAIDLLRRHVQESQTKRRTR